MTKEEAKAFLIDVSHDLGTVGVEHLSVKDGKKMRDAIETLSADEYEECDDCISRQAALDKASYMETEEGWSGRTVDVKDIEALPPVIPKQKMGHWIEHNQYGIVHLECSECSVWFLRAYMIRNSYCPNCGKKMEAEPYKAESVAE